MRAKMKLTAQERLKKQYWLVVIICLFLGLFGISYSSTITVVKSVISGPESAELKQMKNVFMDIVHGDVESGDVHTTEYIEEKQQSSERYGFVVVEHANGVLAQLTNNFFSGRFFIVIYRGIQSITKAPNATLVVMIFLAFVLVIFFMVYLNILFKVTAIRMLLECRIYDKVPKRRFLFFLRPRKSINVVKAVFRRDVQVALWSLTIVGGVIKSYSYALVPYIVAENPTVSGKEAIELSKRMMDGHKMELFIFKLSFLPWEILDFFSSGLLGLFFVNPYTELSHAEYYAYLRSLAIENQVEGVELLNDKYLFEYAPDELLLAAYEDSLPHIEEAEQNLPEFEGIRGFFEQFFGVNLFYDDKEKEYENAAIRRAAYMNHKNIIEKKSYPVRLFADFKQDTIKIRGTLYYNRHYSMLTIVLIFFTCCIVGWSWEVLFHVIEDGEFVNRGVLHGPWLPIYGVGSTAILIFLKKFRSNPVLEFGLAVILAGIMEYYTALYLEQNNNGIRWWDYTGYYMNINGRVCAEGLLLFGILGIAVVYVIAPLLDNIYRLIPKKIAMVVAVVLLVTFAGDLAYSAMNPNLGEGITYNENGESMTKEDCMEYYNEN